MVKELKMKRRKLQMFTWYGLPAVLIGGWFYPALGFFLFACMVGEVAISFYKGRAWCDWMCPRGSFYDLFLAKVSRGREVPRILKSTWFRAALLLTLFFSMSIQFYLHWGDIDGMGMSLVRILTVTTLAGIILGMFYNERLWCHICPMGTVGSWLSKGKKPLVVEDESCAGCKVCSKVCPMKLKPYEYTSAEASDNDCIKCMSCVAACPKDALSFGDKLKKAA